MGYQMTLDLFPEVRRHAHTPEWCIEWLQGVHGCTDAIVPLVESLYSEFGFIEAFERAKCLKSLDGKRRIDGWVLRDAVDVYDLFNPDLDYHVFWDRAWAARNGYGKDDVRLLVGWDYGSKEPIWPT